MTRAKDWPCDPARRVDFPRCTYFKLEDLGPSWLVDTSGTVLLRCACGVILGAPTAHSIDADGTVNPSIICHHPSMGREPCGWHVYGRLLNWPGGAMAARTLKRLPPLCDG